MITGLPDQQTLFFLVLIAAFALLITERLRKDLVAVLIVIALYAIGAADEKMALSGFSSEPAIVVAAIFVLAAALHQTGLSETIGAWIGRLAGRSFTRIVAVIMPAVALLSAFSHHVTTTAVMLPVTLNLARAQRIAPSKLLMPLSFAASLGTTITIIGAPAFLIASQILQQAGRPGLGVFSIAPIGLAISALGTVFTILVGRFLLPSRSGVGDGEGEARFKLSDYFTELKILADSPFLGQTIAEIEADQRYHLRVVGLLRRGRDLPRPYGQRRLEEGDVLLVRTTPEEIVSFRHDQGFELAPVDQYVEDTPGVERAQDVEELEEKIVQVIVAPRGELVGRTISQVDFRRRYGVIVLSIWRRDGWLTQELAQTRLRDGDVLVLQGDEDALERMADDRSFLLMVPFHGESRTPRKAPLAGAIMLATIAAAALNVLPLTIATIAGAIAVVLTGCISPRQAYSAIDARIFVFIAGAIPLGAAMEKTGASKQIAGWLQAAVVGWSQFAVLLAIFAVVAVLTQFMSDSATTALFGPVAVALAQALGHVPDAYVVTVAMASVAAFLTPIGHHGNLLIYGPGGYRFSDFVIVGAPLTILVGLTVALMAPIVWPG
ncbi:MAG TPA: SLC13 family permease [Chloroflexota bacterium]